MEKIIKTIKNNKFLYFIAYMIFNAVIAMIVWPLLDMFCTIVIDKKEFTYSISKYIFEPMFFGFFLTVFTIVFKKIDEKKFNSSTK